MKALIIGATGATGKDIVTLLLKDPAYTEVVAFVRRSTGITHAKFIEVITSFDDLHGIAVQITGDVLFLCMGTTLKAAGSKEKQWYIDYKIPLKFSELAKFNNVPTLVLLSAYGASAGSRVFYSQMKGKLEDAISELKFDHYIIFRPGLLLRKNTDRLGERISAAALKFFNSIGLLRKYKPLPTELLAEKMVKAPKSISANKQIIELDGIFKF